ncbi:LOW QUALITY PROTEIN: uncharacterized protein [Amphiura filiformis]|uniref:LOW QUALITY PROTEIN: uncharacterized protein n=1 Tax=Amphiura filiformis TaxID=82378 RepID=UPI003B215BDD
MICMITVVNCQTTQSMTETITVAVTELVTEITDVDTTGSGVPTGIPTGTAPVLDTTLGLVSGKSLDVIDNNTVFAYLGIPYAAPPIGNFRFAKPQPAAQWNGTFNAIEYGPKCPQSASPFGSESLEEDCLSLNIFVPQVATSDPLPIMVHIPGGGFAFLGSKNDPGENLAATGKVIVVTFNYRLGAFGFLNTNDDCARGNWGLWDQRLAIQWVKDNAERFGGDPNQITIFGKSSGANSALYQALSPLNSNKLFQRVIAQSPTLFNFRSNDPSTGASLTQMLAQNLEYDNVKDSKGMLQFLRNQSVSDLINANLPPRFYPVIDDEFLRGTDLFDSNVDIGQYDLLTGYNLGDVSLSFGNRKPELNKEQFMDHVNSIVDVVCRDYDECTSRDLAVQAATFAYNNIEDLKDNETLNFARAVEISLDVSFSSFVSFLARDHQTRGGNTYAYTFTYEDTEFWPIKASANVVPRPGHTEDLYYVFGTDAISKGNVDQRALSYAFIQYWTNFATNGDPNVGNTEYIGSYEEWPKFDDETQSYMILEPNATVGQNFAGEAYDFWYGYIKSVLEEGETDDEDSEQCVLDAGVPVWESFPPQETKTHNIADLGSITGTILYVPDESGSPNKVNVIRGIPYAKAPVDALRFAPPQEVEPWDVTLDGVSPAFQCPGAMTTDWDEDCLTLDVTFVESNDASLPVVVFIGGYNLQTGRGTPSAEGLAAGTESVVVTFRYRVGALGFLSTGDEYAPGNYGLQDIIAVLKFVNNHISKFGGDPNKVTLMGYGTGGSIVNMLFYLKDAQGLFQRAISLSETASARDFTNIIQSDPLNQATSLGKKLQCKGNPKELLQCLRSSNVTVSDILDASLSTPFFPVVDGDILTDTIPNLVTNSSYSAVDYLIGITENQAATKMMKEVDSCPTENEFRKRVNSGWYVLKKDPGPVRQAIAAAYLDNIPPYNVTTVPCPLQTRFLDFLQDYFVVVPTLDTAKTHIKAGGRVFLYSFQQTPKYRSDHSSHLPSWVGPSRGDDLQYLFGMPYSPLSPGCYGPEDRETTVTLMRILRDFFSSGGASMTKLEDLELQDNTEWPEFDLESRRYLQVDACPSVSETGFGESHLRFWTEVISSLVSPPPPRPGEKEKCIVGEELGISLTPEQAATLFEILIGVIIALLVVWVITCGACCGARKQINENKTSAYELGHEIPGWRSTQDEESDML